MSYGQDWAFLERFKEENKEVATLPVSERKVVFMGNSITEGWLQTDATFFREHGFINRGIGGQTTPQMLLRFRQDVIDLKPRAVVILAGTNDIAGNTGSMSNEEILNNIASMSELAVSHGIKVILCSILPASDYSWSPGKHPDIRIPQVNGLIKEYASRNKHVYVDFFTAMADAKNGLPLQLAEDGVHPTKLGYDKMKTILLPQVMELLKN